MLIQPTYTHRQYWFSILTAGFIIGILSSVVYYILYWLLYVQQSYIFSLIYLLPLLGSTICLFFFRHKYVWNEFTYKSAFLMSFAVGLISALLLSLFLLVVYSFVIESRVDLFGNIDNEKLQRFMSPRAISLSMFIINITLSFIYSLIIAIFAKRKIKE